MSDQDLHLMIDADTIIVKAAMVRQTNYVLYDLDGNRIKPVKSKKSWKEDNPKGNPDDFEFRLEATLVKSGGRPLIEKCKRSVIKTIKGLEEKYPDRKAWVCLEGEGNYREDLYPNYKGSREGSILLREELSDWAKEFFPRVIVAVGCETDDIVATYMWQGHQNFKRTGIHNYMCASCDKDLKTVAGLLYDYGKDEETVISELEADRWFCTQLLHGDRVDTIKGLNGGMPKEYLKARGIRYVSSVGVKTAQALLKDCKTSKECFEQVLECYKHVHEDRAMYAMQEEAIALRMRHSKGEMYKISEHMRALGVCFD